MKNNTKVGAGRNTAIRVSSLKSGPILKDIFKKNMTGWIILAPCIILFAFYIWEPMIYGVVLSFCETVGFRAKGFVGLSNYVDVLSDSIFRTALINTVTYTVFSVLIGYLIPIIIAIVLNEVVHLKSFFKFAIYFPNMVPGVAALILWMFIYDPGQGLLNTLRTSLGMEPSGWLQNSHLTIPLIILTLTWKSAGATAIIYLASLQGINQELYEACSLDGAGILSKIKYITIPSLYNIARLMLIMQVIFVFQILYEPMVMTSGGPNNASMSLMYLSYKYAFLDIVVSKGATISVLVSAILLVLTAVYLKFVKANDMS
jgi:multiple sugar transport system permease protein